MLEIIQFHCSLQEKNKKVTLECLPLDDQYFGYDRTNYYYALYYKLASKDFVRLGTMDILSLCDIYSITSTDRTRTLIFHNKSKLEFSYYNRTDKAIYLQCSFTDPNGNSYNEISNRLSYNTEIPLDKSKSWFLALSGPSDTIPNKNLPQPITRYPYAGGGIFYFVNSDLSNFPSTSGYNRITVTQKNSTNIDWGNYLVGNLLHDQYHDPKFYGDISTAGGGDGDYDDNSSDTIGLPDLTTLNANSINNTRFFTCYKLTPEQLTKLSQELWSTNFIDIISNSVLKPTDFIVSMNMIPIDVMSTPKKMKAGQWLLNGAIGGVVSGQFFRVDCGSIEIKKKWGGALDYLTKIALFLPFIGEVQLSPDDVMGSTISVIYTVDVMTGSCLASVKIVRDNLDAILYQYNGNCSATYPIVSQDYSALMSGVLQLGIHSIADYTKSLPQLKRNGSNKWVIDNMKISRKENLESGATSCLFDISPNVQRVGNMSSTVGFMGIKKPFIILSRPIQSLAENYNTYRGFVSNITMSLGDCEGYTEVEEIHLEKISATENEISEIENLLKTGVIF